MDTFRRDVVINTDTGGQSPQLHHEAGTVTGLSVKRSDN